MSLLRCGIAGVTLCFATGAFASENAWVVQGKEEWLSASKSTDQVEVVNGQAKSRDAVSRFTSATKVFPSKRSVKSITFKQTTAWDNWKEIPNVGAPEMKDALVLLPVKEGDYWMLGRHADYQAKRVNGKKGEKAKRANTEKSKNEAMGGYHAWHSTDMKNWVHRGPISTSEGKWMTTAEYADGKYFLFYDKPNDQDPHLIVDDDLSDGVPGKSYGMALNDPSNGSDSGVLRDEDGTFHLIFEDWSYNDAQVHAWDAPVAGHAISPDGIQPFQILEYPAVDERTTPTGKIGTYKHSSSKTPLKYEIHTPEQNAYGDWTAIKVGGQYYLFCDYDPVGGRIRVGRFTSDSLDKQFVFCGEFGDGHPDPSIGFAKGQFYLIQQRGDVDFVSPGPWVGGVEARVGVNTSGNGKIDEWTQWREIKETYTQKAGFARIVETAPASMDLSSLPEGFGFAFEYRTSAVAGQNVNVVMDQVKLSFQ